MDMLEIKKEISVLAGYLDPNEPMSAEDARTDLPTFVSRVVADENLSETQVALIACSLARFIETAVSVA